MAQQLAHSPQQLLVLLLLLLLPRKASTSSSPGLHDGGKRRAQLAEVSVMIYAHLVCCLVCLMLPGRCHPLKLAQHARASAHTRLRAADVFAVPRWHRKIPHPRTWLSSRPQWNQLEVQNCFPGPAPDDLLSAEEVRAHERAILRAAESQRYLRRTQRILRLQHLQWLSHREFLASFGKIPTRKLRQRSADTAAERALTTAKTPMSMRMAEAVTLPKYGTSSIAGGRATVAVSTNVSSTTTTAATTTTTASTSTEASLESALVTIHRLAIRSKTILISGGVMSARLRYLVQLHRAIEGQHRLFLEVRLHPQYPPIYTGTVEDVCTYWPADAPGSECSQKKRRFYQKGRICLCHMPPGVYQQRLKINFGDVFEGAQISQFLINILFSGQHLNLYVTVQLISATNTTVACSQSKIPVSFSSL